MTRVLIAGFLLCVSMLARAGEPAVLSEDESLLMCAETLPKQLACKEDFCDAMVKMRTKGDKKADLAALKAKCLEEIAVDGTGDVAARKDRCAAWSKKRPKMSMKRADAKSMDACWALATCKERVDCWAPKMAKVMAPSAPEKK